MDELDLVRLARPAAPEPDVSRLRAAALGTATVVPEDAAPIEVPLVAATPVPRRSRWRLAAAAFAAAALVLAGLVVVLRRHGDGSTGPSDDVSTRAGLDGEWSRIWNSGSTGGSITWGELHVTFQSAPNDAMTLSGPCGIYVSRGYEVIDGHLHLTDPLSSPEAQCFDQRAAAFMSTLVAKLSSDPTIELPQCKATYCSLLVLGGDVYLRPVTLTPAPLTLDALDGKTFVLQGMSDDRGATIDLPSRLIAITFAGARVTVNLCNGASGVVTLDGNVLVVTDFESGPTQAACDKTLVGPFRDILLSLPHVLFGPGGSEWLALTAPDGRIAVLAEGQPNQTTPPTTEAGVGVALPTTIAVPADLRAALKGRTFVVTSSRKGTTAGPTGVQLTFTEDGVQFGCARSAPAGSRTGGC